MKLRTLWGTESHLGRAAVLDILDRAGAPTGGTAGRPSLKTSGGAVCFTRANVVDYARSLAEFPFDPRKGRGENAFTYAHLLWVLARPLLDWISMAWEDGADASPWAEGHGTCLSLLASDFDCDFEADQELSLDAFADHAALLMATHLDMEVHGPTLAPAIGPLIAQGLPACATSVHLVLLSRETWAPFMGNALHSTLTTKLLALAAGVAEPVPTTPLEAQLKRELWDLLAAQRPSQTWLDEAPLLLPAQPPLKRSRTFESLQLSLVKRSNSACPWATKLPRDTM